MKASFRTEILMALASSPLATGPVTKVGLPSQVKTLVTPWLNLRSIGQLNGGKLEGKGQLTFANGGVYQGEFKVSLCFTAALLCLGLLACIALTHWWWWLRRQDDKFNGRGRTVLPDGSVHEGEYK